MCQRLTNYIIQFVICWPCTVYYLNIVEVVYCTVQYMVDTTRILKTVKCFPIRIIANAENISVKTKAYTMHCHPLWLVVSQYPWYSSGWWLGLMVPFTIDLFDGNEHCRFNLCKNCITLIESFRYPGRRSIYTIAEWLEAQVVMTWLFNS